MDKEDELIGELNVLFDECRDTSCYWVDFKGKVAPNILKLIHREQLKARLDEIKYLDNCGMRRQELQSQLTQDKTQGE